MMVVQVSLKCSTKVCFVILWFTGSQECQAAGRTSALLESHKVAYTEGWWHPVLNFVVHLAVIKKYYSDHSIYEVPYVFLLEACHSGIVLWIASSGSLHVRLVSLSISIAAKACSASAEFKALQHSLSTTLPEKNVVHYGDLVQKPPALPPSPSFPCIKFQVTGKRRWCLEGSRWPQSSASISSI